MSGFLAAWEELSWTIPTGVESAIRPTMLFDQGVPLGLQVALGRSDGRPKTDDVRAVWRKRAGGAGYPLLLVVVYEKGGAEVAAVCGPVGDDPKLTYDGRLDQIERICAAALRRPDRASAIRFLATAEMEEQAVLPGIRNVGLFATHELASGVIERNDWGAACDSAQQLLAYAGRELVIALGYEIEDRGPDTTILRADGTQKAVAVFLEESEPFDVLSGRLHNTSPVAHALAAADREEVDWVFLVRGSTIRLHPVKPDVGVGRRGRSATFLEANLDLLPQDGAGYLPLIFSAQALGSGSIDEILEASNLFVTDLGGRLRDRVYFDAVPSLATAIARQSADFEPEGLRAAYGRTMTVLFRLLFVAYAEDKELLPYRTEGAYADRSLTTIARELTDRRLEGETDHEDFDADSSDLWCRVAELWTAIEKGHPTWHVPTYGGTLFSTDPEVNADGAALAGIELSDAEFGPTLSALLVDRSADGLLGPVDFRSLSVREFGTIYEGLLESELSVAQQDLTDSKNGLVPASTGDEVAVAEGDVYFHNRSGARKSTGTYFTKPFAVEHLLRHALTPAVDDHLERVLALLDAGDEAAAASTLLDFRIADIAMGSGHFLVAAIDHLEARFSRFLTEHPIPPTGRELAALQKAAEDLLGDLADRYRIDTTQVLRRLIARRCVYGCDLNPVSVELARLAIWIHTFVPGLPLSFLDHNLVVGNSLTGVGTLGEVSDFVEGGLAASHIHGQLEAAKPHLERIAALNDARIEDVKAAREAADAAHEALKPARRLLDMLILARAELADLDPILLTDEDVVARRCAAPEVTDHLQALDPLHFPITFPEVFLRDRPGFDCILGNPPWDEMHVNADKFWARHMPGHMSLPTDQRPVARDTYERERPDLAVALDVERQTADYTRGVVLSGPYPGIGKGVADYYKAFGWRSVALLGPDGHLGYVLPRAMAIGASNKNWRRYLAKVGSIRRVCNLINTKGWVFDGLHFQYPVVLLSFSLGGSGSSTCIEGRYTSLAGYLDGQAIDPLVLSPDELERISDHWAIPSLPAPETADIFETFLQHPRLGDDRGDYRTSTGFNLKAADATDAVANSEGLEADRRLVQGRDIRVLEPVAHLPYTISSTVWDEGYSEPFIAFRLICRADDSRTFMSTVVPAGTVTKEGSYYLCIDEPSPIRLLALAGLLGSRVFDWYTRCFVDFRVLPSLLLEFPVPILDPSNPHVAALARAASDLLAEDPLLRRWIEEMDTAMISEEPDPRLASAELDARAAQLVGLEADQINRLMHSFHRTWDPAEHLELVQRRIGETDHA